jgi:spore germination protein KB
LSERFPGKSLIEINDIVLGKIIGKLFSILYIFYFFSLVCLNANLFSEFTVGATLPETPTLVILIMLIFVCCYAVRKGPKVITYYSTLFVVIAILILIFNSLMLIKDMKLSNFQPFFSLPVIKYIQTTQTVIALPFAETIVYFAFFPNLKEPTNIKKPLFGGLTIGALTILGIVLRDTSVLGPLVSYVISPAFETVRLINVGGIFTRMEVFYATVLTVLIFFKVSILFYVTTKSIEQLLHLNSYKTLIPVIGILAVYASLTIFTSSFEHTFWGSNVAAVYSTFFVFILPLITFIVALLREFYKNKGGNAL